MMAVIAATEKEIKLLARLMRAEAVSDGKQAMLMVGNVGVNRVRGDCLDFVGIRNIEEMVFQRPGGFEATMHSFFYQRARESEIKLARKAVNGHRIWPATYALWFFAPGTTCPSEWYGQPIADRYKSFCYFHPTYEDCPNVYSAI